MRVILDETGIQSMDFEEALPFEVFKLLFVKSTDGKIQSKK